QPTNAARADAVDDAIFVRLARELNIGKGQVARTVELLDEGNTIPFIARYRKERTGELDETQLRDLEERLHALRSLEERRGDVISRLREQGNLSDELHGRILKADTLQQIDDL